MCVQTCVSVSFQRFSFGSADIFCSRTRRIKMQQRKEKKRKRILLFKKKTLRNNVEHLLMHARKTDKRQTYSAELKFDVCEMQWQQKEKRHTQNKKQSYQRVSRSRIRSFLYFLVFALEKEYQCHL